MNKIFGRMQTESQARRHFDGGKLFILQRPFGGGSKLSFRNVPEGDL